MGEAKKKMAGGGTKDPVPAAAVPQADTKKSTIVKTGKYFTLIQPTMNDKNKELFRVPEDAVGRASSLFIALNNAKKELQDHISDAEAKLITALRDAKRSSISLMIAGFPFTCQIMHVNAKEKIVIKK